MGCVMSKDIKGRSAKYKISTKISHKSIMLGFFYHCIICFLRASKCQSDC